MAQRKKFNIWIAYSDLFSNLAVFLFISAFGVFAALGAIIKQNDNPGGCFGAADDVAAILHEHGSSGLHSAIVPASLRVSDGSCGARYQIASYRFVDGRTEIGDFVPAHDPAPISIPDALSAQVCEQLWGAVTRRSFSDKDGLITIVGTIAVDAVAKPICKLTGEQVTGDWQERMHDADCWQQMSMLDAKRRALLLSCQKFATENARCLEKGAESVQNCRLLLDRLGKDAVLRTSCAESSATTRAFNLYKFCRKRILDDGFDFRLIWQKGTTAKQEHDYVGLTSLWNNRVKFRGEAGGGASGAMRVEVQFNRLPAGNPP